MTGRKPATRERILELLDKPENAELKGKFDAMPQYRDFVIKMVIGISNHYDSVEDFRAALDAYERNEKDRQCYSLAGAH